VSITIEQFGAEVKDLCEGYSVNGREVLMARREPWEPEGLMISGSTFDRVDLSGCKCGKPMSEEKKEEVHKHIEEVARRMKLTGEKPFRITKEMWEQRRGEVEKVIPPPPFSKS
jgi:hypothetical protein